MRYSRCESWIQFVDEVGLVGEAMDKHWVVREDEDREDKGGEM